MPGGSLGPRPEKFDGSNDVSSALQAVRSENPSHYHRTGTARAERRERIPVAGDGGSAAPKTRSFGSNAGHAVRSPERETARGFVASTWAKPTHPTRRTRDPRKREPLRLAPDDRTPVRERTASRGQDANIGSNRPAGNTNARRRHRSPKNEKPSFPRVFSTLNRT